MCVYVMLACFAILLVNSAYLKQSLVTDEFSGTRGGRGERRSLKKMESQFFLKNLTFNSTICGTAGRNPENLSSCFPASWPSPPWWMPPSSIPHLGELLLPGKAWLPTDLLGLGLSGVAPSP